MPLYALAPNPLHLKSSPHSYAPTHSSSSDLHIRYPLDPISSLDVLVPSLPYLILGFYSLSLKLYPILNSDPYPLFLSFRPIFTHTTIHPHFPSALFPCISQPMSLSLYLFIFPYFVSSPSHHLLWDPQLIHFHVSSLIPPLPFTYDSPFSHF